MTDGAFNLHDPQTRALTYPYDVAAQSFLFDRGVIKPLPLNWSRTGTPVLGIGSNRAPSQLRRKYAAELETTVIACDHAYLADHDIVFLAAFSGYGALPAAVIPMPGVKVEVHILWLNENALARMHETEGTHNYRFVSRGDLHLTMTNGHPAPTVPVGLYQTNPKVMTLNGAPIPLQALKAQGRSAPAMTQKEALTLAHQRLAPGLEFDTFMDRLIGDAGQRKAWTQGLQDRE